MADVQCDFKFSTDEFTKRIMFGGVGDNLDKRVQHAAEQVGYEAQTRTRAYLYQGHGYITGTLWRSYRSIISPDGSHTYKVHFYTDVFYAPFVEYGTYKMSPRIHFRPGTKEAEGEIPRLLHEAVDEFLKGGE